jgi:hypothetical protein
MVGRGRGIPRRDIGLCPGSVEGRSLSRGNGPAPAETGKDIVDLFRFEPTGLSLLRPYQRGSISVGQRVVVGLDDRGP